MGVSRARDLANQKELSPRTIRRMVSFFARHEVDKQAEGFHKGEEGFPSKGRQAWDLWGGDPGRAWAERMLKTLESQQIKESTVIDVNVLTGADIRRIDGKSGKISKVSMPWVTVKWSDGKEESFLRSDDALAEDIELKTLDKGWVALGAVVGVNEVASTEAAPAEESDSSKPLGDLIAETRLLRRDMTLSEAATKRKAKASAKAKALAAKKKGKKKKSGSGSKTHSPFKRRASRGTTTTPEYGPPPGGTKSDKKTGEWSCSKSGKYVQVCKNSKTGETKTVTIDPAYKKGYNAAYRQATAAGGTNAHMADKPKSKKKK